MSLLRRILLLPLAVAGIAVPVFAASAAGATQPGSDVSSTDPSVDTASAIVQLKGDPVATDVKTRPAPGKKIDFQSTTVKSYRAQLSALRNEFKEWLRDNAPAAKVTGQFDISLNAVSVQLNGVSLDTLRSAPMVASAQYEGVYYPLSDDPDLGIIHAIEAWGSRGAAGAGAGVKVAIIDTGIDITHPCFRDSNPANDGPFTNDKVLDAAVFFNKNQVAKFTPADEFGHGTHVAGTVACNFDTPAVFTGVTIPYGVSGVAPAAKLGNFNVFPGTAGSGRSEDIMNGLEAALEKGYDVANMSLGGGSQGIQDLLSIAVDNADAAGMVVAVAAGNSGPGKFSVSSPGLAPGALTAGASTVPHFVGSPLMVSGKSSGLASGQFKTVDADLTAPLGVVLSETSLSTACSALAAGSLTGKIALVSRGVCTFSTKIRNAQNAGAVATIVVNNVAGDPVAMATDGTANQPTIPAYMTSLANREDLIAANGKPATIGAKRQYFLTTNVDIRAGFSSAGPTDVDFRVKPDVMAPGVNVLSAQPAAACETPPCWAFFQGTSMATPHLAGSAAVVKSQHRDWTSAQIRSAIVNTGDQGVIKSHLDGKTIVNDVNIVGAGRDNLLSAVNAKVALDPVSVSFGAVPSGSGQTLTKTVVLSTLAGSGPYTASVTDQTGKGVSYSATVSGNTVTVTMTASKRATEGHNQGILRIFSGGTEIAHAAVYTLVK